MLETTMQTDLNSMEKFGEAKSRRADEIGTVGYKMVCELSASVSKKNRNIFRDMGSELGKMGAILVVEGRKVVHRAEVSFQRIHVTGFVHADVCRFHVTSGTSVWGGRGWKVRINYDETNERSFAKTEVIRNIGVICSSLVRREKKKRKRKSQFSGEEMPREKIEEEEEEE